VAKIISNKKLQQKLNYTG